MGYKDKEKQNEAVRKWKKDNPTKVKKLNTERKQRLISWWKNYKSTLFCIKCGENRTVCLDFHHRDPKEKDFGISYGLKRWSIKRVLKEIAKCDILCKNCHAIEHENDNRTEEIQETQSFVSSFEI